MRGTFVINFSDTKKKCKRWRQCLNTFLYLQIITFLSIFTLLESKDGKRGRTSKTVSEVVSELPITYSPQAERPVFQERSNEIEPPEQYL